MADVELEDIYDEIVMGNKVIYSHESGLASLAITNGTIRLGAMFYCGLEPDTFIFEIDNYKDKISEDAYINLLSHFGGERDLSLTVTGEGAKSYSFRIDKAIFPGETKYDYSTGDDITNKTFLEMWDVIDKLGFDDNSWGIFKKNKNEPDLPNFIEQYKELKQRDDFNVSLSSKSELTDINIGDTYLSIHLRATEKHFAPKGSFVPKERVLEALSVLEEAGIDFSGDWEFIDAKP